jgi:hypothetical protein
MFFTGTDCSKITSNCGFTNSAFLIEDNSTHGLIPVRRLKSMAVIIKSQQIISITTAV